MPLKIVWPPQSDGAIHGTHAGFLQGHFTQKSEPIVGVLGPCFFTMSHSSGFQASRAKPGPPFSRATLGTLLRYSESNVLHPT